MYTMFQFVIAAHCIIARRTFRHPDRQAEGYRTLNTDGRPWARIENVENLHHKIYDLLDTDDK